MRVFDINYQKRKNKELFKEIETNEVLAMHEIQNYNPIYKHFFALNESNYNNINLNNDWYLSKIMIEIEERNCFKCEISNLDESMPPKPASVFFKMAPLLDPYKYMIGKYNVEDPKLFTLPSINSTDISNKLMDPNNCSYVDGFFSFLTSKLLSQQFIHGINFYGSFVGIKKNFIFNAIEDIEYLCKSEFFKTNKNVLFEIQDYSHMSFEDDDEPVKKPLINISNDNVLNDEIEIISEELPFENNEETILELTEVNVEELTSTMIPTHSTTLKTSSSCSSRTSHTTNEETHNANKSDSDSDNDENDDGSSSCFETVSGSESSSNLSYSDSDSSSYEEETLYANIPKFPIHLISMEKCKDTLDNLILKSEMNNDEWMSMFMQVIMILLTYQKIFSFTHNDLHTNNIMYNETKQKFLYYFYNKKYYKVPTYGKVFKIIDFGRSIYKFNDVLFCSDSFQTGNDAATQYNTEPFMNNNKPRLDPNYSFDLCRLACSIFDYVVEDLSMVKELTSENPFIKLIVEWCIDDNGMNVLYKTNGEERYPEFKLYKMIARHVHAHTPEAQLKRSEFTHFEVHKNIIKSVDHIMRVDEYLKKE